MKKFIMITVLLLCSLSWISVSGSESQTVEVQSGEEVTLTCSNMSRSDGLTFWFRLDQTSKPTCISVMTNSKSRVNFCDGFINRKYNMTTNINTVSLTIKRVNSSDSGLYFCGFYEGGIHTFCVKRLNVKGTNKQHDDKEYNNNCISEPHAETENKNEKSDGTTQLISYILAGLTALLVLIIIGLVVKVRKLQTVIKEEQNPEQRENTTSDDLNYAAVTFRNAKTKRRELEPNVIYAATR